MVFNLAAGGTEAADALFDFKGPGASGELERLADQGAGGAGCDTVTAEVAIQRLAGDGLHQCPVTAGLGFDSANAGDLTADLDTLFTEDAAVGITLQQRPVITYRQPLQIGAVFLLGNLQAVAGVLQIALTGCIADRTIQRVVDQHQFHGLFADRLKLRRLRGHLDPFLDRGVAGGHGAGDPFHMDGTDPAGAGGGDLLQPAEGRDRDPQLLGSLKDGGPGRNLHILAVNGQGDGLVCIAAFSVCHCLYPMLLNLFTQNGKEPFRYRVTMAMR